MKIPLENLTMKCLAKLKPWNFWRANIVQQAPCKCFLTFQALTFQDLFRLNLGSSSIQVLGKAWKEWIRLTMLTFFNFKSTYSMTFCLPWSENTWIFLLETLNPNWEVWKIERKTVDSFSDICLSTYKSQRLWMITKPNKIDNMHTSLAAAKVVRFWIEKLKTYKIDRSTFLQFKLQILCPSWAKISFFRLSSELLELRKSLHFFENCLQLALLHNIRLISINNGLSWATKLGDFVSA